jgi:predicted outer membrane repeat protein
VDRAAVPGHAQRAAFCFVILLGQAALIFAAAPPAEATASSGAIASCQVRNPATRAVYVGGGANLQDAIRHAVPGSVLIIRGRCVGTFHINEALTLVGRPSDGFPIPTLDGNGAGTVLTTYELGNVIVRNLRITGGMGTGQRFGGTFGGGIANRRGRVVLAGTTRVTGNASESGGGIWNNGTLILRDAAVVARNRATGILGVGGGIYERGGHLRMRDSSSVRKNRAVVNGGGIFQFQGQVIIRDDASVRANRAGNFGGGIYFEVHTLTLKGSAHVTGNTARAGGGIFSEGNDVNVCSPSVKISPNRPDDPPATAPC